MPMVRIFEVFQRTEDSEIIMNSSIQNPLFVLDLLITAQKMYVSKAAQTMEFKKESSLITGEQGKAIIT